jgi:flagellin
MSAIQAYNNLDATDTAMSTAISRLSSGLQIQTAADNPAGYVTSEALSFQSTGYQQAMSNAQDTTAMVQTATGALNQITSILQTMDQLAVASANSATNDSTSLQANEQEFSALQSQINQIANSTSYGTTQLLNSNQTFTVQVGAFAQNGATAAGGNAYQQIAFSISAVTTGALALNTTSVSVANAASASSAIAAVQSALSLVDTIESSLGATQNELGALVANLTVGNQNLQAAYSGMVDVNMAQEMTTFSTDQILMQTGVAMLAQAQTAPSLILKLI